jgi:hypothetical protein
MFVYSAAGFEGGMGRNQKPQNQVELLSVTAAYLV